MQGSLHLLTDHRAGRDATRVVEAALGEGVDVVQVRAKGLTDRGLYELAGALLALCRHRGVACVVDDRVDVALAIGADGVHVGESDLPVAVARRLLGREAIVGATARDVAGARAAAEAGATYVGVGPCYATSTKDGLPDPLGPTGLAEVCAAVELPVVAIGGITAERVPEVRRSGAAGIAVVTAVSEAPDPAAAVRRLRAALDEPPRGGTAGKVGR